MSLSFTDWQQPFFLCGFLAGVYNALVLPAERYITYSKFVLFYRKVFVSL